MFLLYIIFAQSYSKNAGEWHFNVLALRTYIHYFDNTVSSRQRVNNAKAKLN